MATRAVFDVRLVVHGMSTVTAQYDTPEGRIVSHSCANFLRLYPYDSSSTGIRLNAVDTGYASSFVLRTPKCRGSSNNKLASLNIVACTAEFSVH